MNLIKNNIGYKPLFYEYIIILFKLFYHNITGFFFNRVKSIYVDNKLDIKKLITGYQL